MKVIIECEVFTYDELPKSYQTVLLHKEMEAVAELWEPDFLIDEFEEELEAIGFCVAGVWYSGFGNQGDGCCFDAVVDLVKVCKHLGIEYNPDVDNWVCEIEKINHNYVHERTRRINFCAPALSLLDERVQGVGLQIERLRLKLCRDFYAKLVKHRDSEMTEEILLSNLRARRYVYRLGVTERLMIGLNLLGEEIEEVVLV